MRKFFTLLIIIASCQKMAAIPIAEQYKELISSINETFNDILQHEASCLNDY